MEEIILSFAGFASRVLNRPVEEIASLLKNEDGTFKPEGLAEVEGLYVKHVDGQKSSKKDSFDQGHAKGKGEAMKVFEKALKTHFGHTSESKGIDLVNEVVESVKTKALEEAGNGEPAELTDDAVLKHPLYLAKDKELREANEGITAKINEVHGEYAAKATESQVRDAARKALLALNPILPEETAKADNQVALFMNDVMNADFQVVEGQILILDESGAPKQDSFGHTLQFDNYVKGKAELVFDFKKSQDRNSTGTEQQQPGAGGDNKEMPKTLAEYTTLLNKVMSEKDFDFGGKLTAHAKEQGWI